MAMNNELMLPLESNDGGIVTPDACFIFQLCSLANFALIITGIARLQSGSVNPLSLFF